jgi:hypothetical protein
MDAIRIYFSLEELCGLLCCSCDIRNAFLYGKMKEKVYITDRLEFDSALLCGMNFIINKLLHWLKTLAIRFEDLDFRSNEGLSKLESHNWYVISNSQPVSDHLNWKHLSRDCEEEILNDFPRSEETKDKMNGMGFVVAVVIKPTMVQKKTISCNQLQQYPVAILTQINHIRYFSGVVHFTFVNLLTLSDSYN